MATRDDIINELKKRGYNGPEVQQAQAPVAPQPIQGGLASTYGTANVPKSLSGAPMPQPQAQAPALAPVQAPAQPTLADMIAKLQKPKQEYGVRQNIGDAISILGGGKSTAPAYESGDDYSKLYAEQAIKDSFKSETDKLVERAKAAEAAKTMGDRELYNSLTGNTGESGSFGQVEDGSSLIGEQGKYLGEIDKFTGKPTPRAIEAQTALRLKATEEGARSRAQVKTEQTKRDAANSARIIEADLDDALTSWKAIPKHITGPIQGRTTGALAKGLQVFGGETATEYDDTVDFVLANIARQLGGERGVLTDPDIMRIKKALPVMRDKESVANTKIARIKRFIARRVAQAQSGELAGFGADMEDELTDFAGSELDTQVNSMLDQLGAE